MNSFISGILIGAYIIILILFIKIDYIKDELYENNKNATDHISGVSTIPIHISGNEAEKSNNISGTSFPLLSNPYILFLSKPKTLNLPL